MDEYLGQFLMQPGDGYSGLVDLGLTKMTRNRVSISRQPVTAVRQNPFRARKSSRHLWSTYGVAWDFNINEDFASLRFIMESLADRGSAENVEDDGVRWSIGWPDQFRYFEAFAEISDGSSYKLANGVLQSWSITVTPSALVSCSSQWEFATLSSSASHGAADNDEEKGAAGTGITSALTWAGVELVAFSASLTFTRELRPGGVDVTAVPAGFTGSPAVMISGRVSCRTTHALADTIFTSQAERAMTLSVTAGEKTVLIEIPAAIWQMTGRRVVDEAQVEHAFELSAIMTGTSPLAQITLTEPPA